MKKLFGILCLGCIYLITVPVAPAQEDDHHAHEGHHQEGVEDHDGYDDHDDDHQDHDHADEDEGHHHVHTAPHGGTLVVLGDHFAHLEFVLDDDEGEITAYVLDAEADKAIRISQPAIEVVIGVHQDDEHHAHEEDHFTVTLQAVARELTGETVGDTSEFSARSQKLVGVEDFEATVKSLEIKGQELADIRFHFPEGNE